MNEIRQSPSLSANDKKALIEAAQVLRRLEGEHRGDVLFDSCDQYYVGFEDVAKAFEELAA